MLVLSRRSNESIVIGGEVVVTVLEIRGDQVRLGIRAPRSVTVHRQEVHAEIQRENESAAVKGAIDVGRLPKANPSS
jgi:carbon storage regulator